MNPLHTYYISNGFRYIQKSCECNNQYIKDLGVNGAIVVERAKCRNNRRHVRCPWLVIYAQGGGIVSQVEQTTIEGYQNFIMNNEIVIN